MATTGFDITSFKNNFRTGARSYLFYIDPVFPNGLTTVQRDMNNRFLVKSSSLPSTSYDEIPASWQGFDYKSAGKRTYDTWNISFNVDVNAGIRKSYANWMDYILDPVTNKAQYPENYMVDQPVYLLGLDFAVIMKYTLRFAYPSSVAEVSLDYTNSDFAVFDVSFTYTFFEHDK